MRNMLVLRCGGSPPGLGFSEQTSLCLSLFLMQLKEMCRRELDKAESEIKKNSSIIGDYKQVVMMAALGTRLECLR